MKKMSWNISGISFISFSSPPAYHVTVLASSPDSIDLDMRPRMGTMQPNMPLTNICGLDLDMTMLDFKQSTVPGRMRTPPELLYTV